jgi:hypothetical protein
MGVTEQAQRVVMAHQNDDDDRRAAAIGFATPMMSGFTLQDRGDHVGIRGLSAGGTSDRLGRAAWLRF